MDYKMITNFKLWESSHEEQVKNLIDNYRDQAKDLGFNISIQYNQETGRIQLNISMIELSTMKTLSAKEVKERLLKSVSISERIKIEKL